MTLSKSQYIRGLQCLKSLWLHKKKPELMSKDNSSQETLFNIGYDVGDLAKELFSNGVEIQFNPDDFDGMIKQTQKLIAKGCEVIYEASFKENGIFAMADILVKDTETNSWDIYEVKASTSVKDYYIEDASVQFYCLSNILKINKVYIVHINNQYERMGKLNIKELFTIEDISTEVRAKQEDIPSNLEKMDEILKKDTMPNIAIGGQCGYPNPCNFEEYCWSDIFYPSVFNLYRMNFNKKLEMYQSGMKSYEDIPSDFYLNKTQQIQVDSFKSNKVHIDKKIIRDFIKEIKYPINFFDFETFQNAIPRFDKQRPYMQIPFQYSLHILYEDGRLEHKEFLGDEDIDPRDDLIEQMLSDITTNGSIVAYNQSFEIGRIRELAKYNLKKEKELLDLIDRFVDLIVPFRSLGYYHPNFNGSFSIKAVLPAMFPNDDELDYKKLGSIQNGGDAMDTFANLHLLKNKSKRDDIRKDLLAYCHLDTLAMVRIYEKLVKIIEK